MAHHFLFEVLGACEWQRLVLLPGGTLVLRDGSYEKEGSCEFVFGKQIGE